MGVKTPLIKWFEVLGLYRGLDGGCWILEDGAGDEEGFTYPLLLLRWPSALLVSEGWSAAGEGWFFLRIRIVCWRFTQIHRWDFLRYLPTNHLFNAAKFLLVFVIDKRNCSTCLGSACGTANAVDVVFRIGRCIEVDYQINAIHINTAG